MLELVRIYCHHLQETLPALCHTHGAAAASHYEIHMLYTPSSQQQPDSESLQLHLFQLVLSWEVR